MNKKIDIQGLDIPKDDVECWWKYPKHRWVYETSRLLDAQNIKWSPYKHELYTEQVPSITLMSTDSIEYTPGSVFVGQHDGEHLLSSVYISKGEIKLLQHYDALSRKEIVELIGNIELRISAFVSMHFQKFTGVITIESIGHVITSIRLRPELDLITNVESVKLIKRIYKKNDLVHIHGLTDQQLHEVLVS
jgi:hypothetical protein